PYKMIAADVNHSGSITTMDLIELRKLILHIDEDFSNNTSWRFMEAAFAFPIPTNPFASIFPEEIALNGLTANEQHDFVGVKVGDVNGSATANAMADAEARTFVGDLVLEVKDQELKAGGTYEVSFRANNFEAMHGYQFTLNFDQDAISFAGAKPGALPNMNESNFGLALLDRGVITTSWTAQTGQSLERGSDIFTIVFTAKRDAKLSQVFDVNSRYTKAEAYNGNLELMDVILRFETDRFVTTDFRLYQNMPNPFKEETVIGFELPESTKGTLSIYDASGRILKQIDGDFVKGYNSINLSKDALSPGLLYYKLITPNATATKKMIFLK
ncbi:MAG: hypothetical protein ACI9XB_000706, partial [Gammaproteobacteria bacterium]